MSRSYAIVAVPTAVARVLAVGSPACGSKGSSPSRASSAAADRATVKTGPGVTDKTITLGVADRPLRRVRAARPAAHPGQPDVLEAAERARAASAAARST